MLMTAKLTKKVNLFPLVRQAGTLHRQPTYLSLKPQQLFLSASTGEEINLPRPGYFIELGNELRLFKRWHFRMLIVY